MITRIDALIKYGVFPSERMQRDMGAMINGAIRGKSAAKYGTWQEAQEFTIFPIISIIFDMKKALRSTSLSPQRQKKEPYSIGTSYSKQVIYLPPFPPGDRSYQGDCISQR